MADVHWCCCLPVLPACSLIDAMGSKQDTQEQITQVRWAEAGTLWYRVAGSSVGCCSAVLLRPMPAWYFWTAYASFGIFARH